jgi:Fibronectin type III domain
MAQFPTTENDMFVLGGKIHIGLAAHGDVFPDPPYGPAQMGPLLSFYQNSRAAALDAYTAKNEAMALKQSAFADLTSAVKGIIRYAENTVGISSAKLELIGWGPRKEPEAMPVPGPPEILEAVVQGTGTIELAWRKPANGSGGSVNAYLVEQRQMNGAMFDDWVEVGFSFETMLTLSNQPRGVTLEFRVKAVNKSGESSPGNTIAVVL